MDPLPERLFHVSANGLRAWLTNCRLLRESEDLVGLGSVLVARLCWMIKCLDLRCTVCNVVQDADLGR